MYKWESTGKCFKTPSPQTTALLTATPSKKKLENLLGGLSRHQMNGYTTCKRKFQWARRILPILNLLTTRWRLAATLILRVGYGVKVKDTDDPYVEIAIRGSDAISRSGAVGSTPVDVFPFREFRHYVRVIYRLIQSQLDISLIGSSLYHHCTFHVNAFLGYTNCIKCHSYIPRRKWSRCPWLLDCPELTHRRKLEQPRPHS